VCGNWQLLRAASDTSHVNKRTCSQRIAPRTGTAHLSNLTLPRRVA